MTSVAPLTKRVVPLLAFALLANMVGPATALSGSRRLPTFVDCGVGRAKIRPAHIVFACGDGNFYVSRLHWSYWTRRSASGRGIGHQNLCNPSCATGHFHTYKVAVKLSQPKICAKKLLEFTRVYWRFVGRKPLGVKRSGTATPPLPPTDARCP
jgi:hypothetical protein